MSHPGPHRSRRSLAAALSLAAAMLVSAGCEIVQSNIPITFDDGTATEVDGGGNDFPPYPGAACGLANAVLCTISTSAVDAGPEASIDAGLDADAGSDADAGLDADAGDGADASPGAAEGDAQADLDSSLGASSEGWCALRCFRHCDTQVWECIGTVCGDGEPPPSCEPAE
ncbi:MAG: hypothetical protein R3B07_16270 [Polyangiaceae bacterium]